VFHVKHRDSSSAEIEATQRPAVGPATEQRLRAYTALLIRWNATIKLVSRQDLPHLQERHLDDALQLAVHIPAGVTDAVDLGSGAGFPGLILAIATGVHFHLIEADSRKAAFLQEAAAATQAPATIHAGRIEDIDLPSCMVVTARALAPLPKLLDLAHPFLSQDGICLFPKGEHVEAEIADAQKDWTMDLKQIPSRTSQAGRILHISRLSRRGSVSS
jgi:16S rRNA (guanine527-N7)-methyltransferase